MQALNGSCSTCTNLHKVLCRLLGDIIEQVWCVAQSASEHESTSPYSLLWSGMVPRRWKRQMHSRSKSSPAFFKTCPACRTLELWVDSVLASVGANYHRTACVRPSTSSPTKLGLNSGANRGRNTSTEHPSLPAAQTLDGLCVFVVRTLAAAGPVFSRRIHTFPGLRGLTHRPRLSRPRC